MAIVKLFKSFEAAGIFRNNLQDTIGLGAVKLLASDKTTDDTHHIFDVFQLFRFELAEAMLVYGDAVYDVLLQGFCGPDAEIGGFFRVDTVADGDDGVEVVHFYRTLRFSVAFGLNQ